MGPRKHVLGEVHTDATWRIPLNCPCVAAMRPVVKLLWPLVFLPCTPIEHFWCGDSVGNTVQTSTVLCLKATTWADTMARQVRLFLTLACVSWDSTLSATSSISVWWYAPVGYNVLASFRAPGIFFSVWTVWNVKPVPLFPKKTLAVSVAPSVAGLIQIC